MPVQCARYRAQTAALMLPVYGSGSLSEQCRLVITSVIARYRPGSAGYTLRIELVSKPTVLKLEADMLRAKLAMIVASLLAISAVDAWARGGGGGPGGIGSSPVGGFGGPHAGSLGPGVSSRGSLPSLPSHGTFPHLPDTSPGLPHAPSAMSPHSKAHASKNKARGLNRAMSRMSPQGAKNTNNPLSPNRAHGRARAAERHALLDRPGRR